MVLLAPNITSMEVAALIGIGAILMYCVIRIITKIAAKSFKK